MDDALSEPPYTPLESEDLLSNHSIDQDVQEWPAPDISCLDHQTTPSPDPFQSLIDELGLLNDTQGVDHVTGILKLYSSLWECYIAKKADVNRISKENEILRASNIHLCQELQILERQHATQEEFLAVSEQGFENVRKGIMAVLGAWDYCPLPTAEPQNETQLK
ncbi:uncharacterized protein N7484_008192 [Penicillium longicatenatum]|uniref:uncharacterized protein n=1 Tax=Penicillium longicatenatum TaxID=1561947 RepID=UPI0025475982|nr:uncharacterized protein N7484_008192 [Penicillium longicatenatum]KAJ5640330.1 hypothetical protein N7484_008192 [Penicillium longicatenatum]